VSLVHLLSVASVVSELLGESLLKLFESAAGKLVLLTRSRLLSVKLGLEQQVTLLVFAIGLLESVQPCFKLFHGFLSGPHLLFALKK
jgi:hypothetical protein